MPGIPMTAAAPAAVRSFDVSSPSTPTKTYLIAGVTRDSTGAAVGNCAIALIRTADNSVAALATSDGSGVFSIAASPALNHQLQAYLAGSPDVAGASVNTLVGT